MNSATNANRGYALVTALLFLLVLTLIGVTAMRTTTLEERMMANMRDLDVAFRASESALRDAEVWLSEQMNKNIGSDSGLDNIWTLDASQDADGALVGMVDQDIDWWAANASKYPLSEAGQSLDEDLVKTQPRSIIQYTVFVPDSTDIGKGAPAGIDYYRITSRGSGVSDQSVSILQGNYAKRFN